MCRLLELVCMKSVLHLQFRLTTGGHGSGRRCITRSASIGESLPRRPYYLVGLVRCLSGARSGHNRMEQRWSQFPSKDLTAFGRRRDDVPFHLNDENVVSMLSMLSMLPTFINIILFQSSASVDCYIILIPMCERI